MDASTVTQIVTVALAVLAIIWHQQRSTDKLRDRLVSVEQRLARIEGFLGIGMPNAVPQRHPAQTSPTSRNRPRDRLSVSGSGQSDRVGMP